MVRNHALGAVPTCGDVRASSSFVKEVTGKGGCADDEEARGQGGHDPQKQQDCPEATVNWKPRTEDEKQVSPGCSRLSHREFVPQYSNFVQGLLGRNSHSGPGMIFSRNP